MDPAMGTLMQVIEDRLAQEGRQFRTSTKGSYSRDAIAFPKTYTPEDYLVKKEDKHKTEHRILVQSLKESKLRNLSHFFVKNPCINLRNFTEAKKLFFTLFTDINSFRENYIQLSQDLDKQTDKFHTFGKAHLRCLKDGQLCLERSSFEHGYFKQYISIDFEKREFSACTVWSGKTKALEMISSRKPEKRSSSKHSLAFDVQIWKSFNGHGISAKDCKKALECIERNHLELESFIIAVNSLDIFNIAASKLIKNPKIQTNSRDTSFLDFSTKLGQSVKVKIAKHAASIIIRTT